MDMAFSGVSDMAVKSYLGEQPRSGVARTGPQRSRGRVLFGLMSSYQSDRTVGQLVTALGGRTVVVHHDGSKQPGFSLPHPAVDMVPNSVVTGWGTWGFAQAIALTLRHALQHHDFDYFQLLSPTCLPIRPIDEFEAHVLSDGAEIHADLMDVLADPDTLMHFGYRLFSPTGSLRFKVLRRVRGWYVDSHADLVQVKSLSMFRRPTGAGTPGTRLSGEVAHALTRLAALGALGRNPFGSTFRPIIGSIWFGARRRVCEYLINRIEDPAIDRYFSRLHLVDESVWPTLLGNSGFRLGPSNHVISHFDAMGHPRWIGADDLDAMRSTGRFFARKFVDDSESPVRLRALELAGAQPVLNVEQHVDR